MNGGKSEVLEQQGKNRMREKQKDEQAALPNELQQALGQNLVARLPLTFQPFVNQQLREWNYLFPNERRSVEQLVLYAASLNTEQFEELFFEVKQLEAKMGVQGWPYSTKEQTIQNSSLLARSPYFQQWRQAVQKVFNAADQYDLRKNGNTSGNSHRLVLLDLPRQLPVMQEVAWGRWQGIGKVQQLVFPDGRDSFDAAAYLLWGDGGSAGDWSGGLMRKEQARTRASEADTWVIDAAGSLTGTAWKSLGKEPEPILLSYDRLDAYRENFSREMNTMRKDLTDADSVYDHLRSVDVTGWCPQEVNKQPAVREFVRSLYLSGNGAVIFGNSFVEWGASEALRRARPAMLAARFDVRSRPKPFTGVAVFENPDQVNPLPSVPDVEGSTLDAQVLALYIWLAAMRYEEYSKGTVCVCLAESIAEAYVIAPEEFRIGTAQSPMPIGELRESLRSWMA